MTKQELLSALTNTYQSFIIGLVIPHLITDDAWKLLSGKEITFTGPDSTKIIINPQWYSDILLNTTRRIIALGELEKILKRAILREGHEFILLYCEQTNQIGKYKAVAWFQFARIMRNLLSHKQNGVLDQWPNNLKKKGITSVTWRKRTFDINMVGQEIQFTHHEALTLFFDYMDFVQNDLI